MAVSSYGNPRNLLVLSRLLKILMFPLKAVDILIVEDIIDSGLTLSYLIDVLERRNA